MMDKLRRFFQEKIILSAVMCLLLAVVSVAAAYGWYAVNNSTKAYGLELKAGGTGKIEVRIKPKNDGGVDIMSNEYTPKDPNGIPIISINLKDFENIENGKIAPGAYGLMPFYITALDKSVDSYSIKVQMEYKPSENASVTEEQKKQIESIIYDHISIYRKKIDNADGSVSFENPLTFYAAATGPLEYGVEVPVENLYWVWNYEVTDIPDYESIDRFSGMDEKTAIRKYDEEDTILGNYIDDIWFNVYIEGRMGGAKD